MKRIFVLTGILFLSTQLFAQLQISGTAVDDQTSHIQLDITLTQSLPVGFAIELPAVLKGDILSARIGTTELWLKNDASTPQAANLLHWFKQQEQIILLFSANVLTAGNNIQLDLQLFRQGPLTGPSLLRLNQVQAAGNQTYQISSQFSQAVIPQTNNIETR